MMDGREWKRAIALALVVLAAGAVAGCELTAVPGGGAQTQEPAPREVSIQELEGETWQEFVGQVVTVRGIFVRDPVPLLVTELDLVRMNMPMPPDQYVLLEGPVAAELDPAQYGGAELAVTGEVLAMVEDEEERFEPVVALLVHDFAFVRTIELYNVSVRTVQAEPWEVWQNRYAVLFSGGISASANRIRYWNDLQFMYETLTNRLGFPRDQVHVLYADGTALTTTMPVDFSATGANLQTVFRTLAGEMDSSSTLFFFSTNHGGGFRLSDTACPNCWGGILDTGSDERNDVIVEQNYNLDLDGNGTTQDIVSWDEELCTWGGHLFDDDLRTMLSELPYEKMIVVMEQCFSGGLIYDLKGPQRILMSATGEYEFSFSSTAQSDNYDEFSFHLTCALAGQDPAGNEVNADADGDGHVSMMEAFNYAVSNDVERETPWYDDNGDGAPASGIMPAAGEGTFGGSTWLR